ncbi:MAG: ABC transporter ATP-binding protein [Acetobacteraceae bacterium]|nr:ABC transporter ATP-binding protein [Acetobacteraceae bacterium]
MQVRGLRTVFSTYSGKVRAVDGVDFDLGRGEAIGIVGESGCGKTVTALSILRLVPEPGRIVDGSVLFEGEDLVKKTDREMQRIRGNEISMIFQDPMTSLNPVLTIGLQIVEVLQRHQGMGGRQARRKAVEMLDIVGIPNPESRIAQYPHQFSGGMRQRAMIAIALACNPKLLIADEPTTSLDVTIQAQIIDLLVDLKGRLDTAIMIITHDLGVVARIAQRVIVMYAGKIIEEGPVREIYQNPRHPYTVGLLSAVPRLDAREKKRLVPIYGQPPDLIQPPRGCAFSPRCDYAMRVCAEAEPEVVTVSDGHRASCWLQHPLAPKVELRKAVGQ